MPKVVSGIYSQRFDQPADTRESYENFTAFWKRQNAMWAARKSGMMLDNPDYLDLEMFWNVSVMSPHPVVEEAYRLVRSAYEGEPLMTFAGCLFG